MARQQENRADGVIRTRSNNSAVTGYAQALVGWQRHQSEWLRRHASTFRAALDAPSPP